MGIIGELLEKSGLSLFIPMSHPRMRKVRVEKQSRATNSLERERKKKKQWQNNRAMDSVNPVVLDR